MELIELKCKNCGAILASADNATEIKCDFCNTIFKISKKDYKKIGYDFENGRIQAQLDYYDVDLSDDVTEDEFDIELSGWKAQAIRAAKNYLEDDPYSKEELKKELIKNNFTEEEAQYGVDNCGVDWNKQAVRAAKNYLEDDPYSKEELKKELIKEYFSEEEAQYGVDNVM